MTLKRTDIDALLRYQNLVQRIAEETNIVISETKEQKEKRLNTLRKNYSEFVKYYFPHYCKNKENNKIINVAKFQIDAANYILKNKNARYVAMWARGHGKSVTFNVMIPIWLMIQDLNKPLIFVLVGKSYENAKTLLSDLQAELEENHLLINDFGTFLKNGNWQDGKFATNYGSAFFAIGRGQSPRGLRYRSNRPNYIVMDDVDDDELCRNPKRVNDLYDWALTALFGTMDSGNGRMIIVGNKIAQNSLISKFEENTKFYVQKVNLLDNKNQPSWPEKISKKVADELIETIGYRRAQAEYFNNPIVEGAVFKHEWIKYIEPLPLRKYHYILSYCDPSFKDSATSDYKAIITVGKINTDFHILDCFIRKCSISEMVRYWYDFHESLNDIVVDYFMEANFAQDMILEEFYREGFLRGYQLPLRKDIRNKPDKFARIEAISPLFERGYIYISSKIKNSEDCKTLIEQLLAFEKGSKAYDDGPDALEGAIYILNKRGKNFKKRIITGKYNKSYHRQL